MKRKLKPKPLSSWWWRSFHAVELKRDSIQFPAVSADETWAIPVAQHEINRTKTELTNSN